MMSRFRVVPVVSEKVYRYGACMIFIYFVNSTELNGVWVCTIRIVITKLRIN